jgi:hypothetical protein
MNMERFNVKKLKEGAVKEQYQVYSSGKLRG